MKKWILNATWLFLPGSALSILALVNSWLNLVGVSTEQWTSIVHGIIVRWNYWHGVAFHWIDVALPIDLNLDLYQRNAIIAAAFYLPSAIVIMTYFLRRYVWARIGLPVSMLIAGGIGYFFGDSIESPIGINGILVLFTIIYLVVGLYGMRLVRRPYFNALMIAVLFVLSMEFIRLVPEFQPYVDTFQLWVEETPTDYQN